MKYHDYIEEYLAAKALFFSVKASLAAPETASDPKP